ncbi:CD63 antigen [Nymphon striatum]|nr:CD63 antigen [Nymphon striatum]
MTCSSGEIGGIGLIAVGAVVQHSMKDYMKLVDPTFSTPPIMCIVVGVLITIIAFFGCCGAIKENYCMTMTFAVIMGIILILELAAGILAYTLRGKVEKLLHDNSLKAIDNYNTTKFKDFQSAIDDIQMSGCKVKATAFFKDHIKIIGGVGIALAVIQVLGVIFACCLARTIKNEGEYA